MSLKVHNTLTGKLQQFEPRESKKVKMYVCGITPYSSSHIGHARCYIIWDTFRRYLEFSGYEVNYIQNFTDIDDKIINKANELNQKPEELAKKHMEEYFQQFDQLNVKRADNYPKVTEHIPAIIELIKTLVENGSAYESKGDVFFEVGKFKEYGKLSKQSLDELIKGKRVEVNPNKRNAADFALWKAAKTGEPAWDSPWGKGRPGWHIECSVMSMKYLGEQLDLHCGGQDLIFPHHENEIAQSEAASGKVPFSKFWLHNGFVTIKREKMAKSEGNILPLSEMLQKYEGETIRFFMLQTHYRQPSDYSEKAVMQAKESLANLKNAIERMEKNIGEKEKTTGMLKGGKEIRKDDKKDTKIGGNNGENDKVIPELEKIRNDFISAMDDDFNTPAAITALFELRDLAFKKMESAEKEDEEKKSELGAVLALLKELGGVLGLFKKAEKKELKVSEKEIEKLIAERQEAKKNKDYSRADEIRKGLKGKGILLEDNKDGSVGWRVE